MRLSRDKINLLSHRIADAVAEIPGVETEVQIPAIANAVPHLHITWDYEATGMTPRDVQRVMSEGTPSIAVNPNVDEDLIIGVWMMEPGEDQIVADRLRGVLATA